LIEVAVIAIEMIFDAILGNKLAFYIYISVILRKKQKKKKGKIKKKKAN